MEEFVLLGLGTLILLYLLKVVLLPGKKGLIAFDLDGVFTKGDFLTERIEEREGMRSLVKRLRGNYNVALVTNDNSESFKVFEKKFGLSKLFQERVVSGRVGARKPDPKIFSYLLRTFNASADKTIFIDDKKENAEAAKKLGINGIHFVSFPALINELRGFGVKV
jgi:2-haloacid dehalogenase